MNLNELSVLGWAMLGWFAYMVDQWDKAVTKNGDAFNWGIFIHRNLAAAIFNFIAMLVLTGVAISTDIHLSIMESFTSGFIGGQVLKNRIQKNGKV